MKLRIPRLGRKNARKAIIDHKHVKKAKEWFREQHRKVKFTPEEHRLHRAIEGKNPNLGEIMNYFDKHVGPKIKVKEKRDPKAKPGQRRKVLPGGPLFERLVKQYERTGSVDPLPKELEHTPINRALELTFTGMADTRAERGNGRLLREGRLKGIVKKLYKEGRISLEGETKISLGRENVHKIVKTLGQEDARTFVKSLRNNLRTETGWLRWYIEEDSLTLFTF